MAVVRFYRTMPLANGNFAPVTGWLRFTPTGRRVIVGDPDNTVLPIAFSVDLENGAASVDISATGADWVWKIDEFISKKPGDARAVPDRTYYVAVPTGAGPIDDPDLVRVNAGDYTPIDTTKNVSLAELDSRVDALEAGGGGTGGGGTAPDATTTTKGMVQLAGDLGGTAASPTVPGLAGKANTSHTHAASDIASGTMPTARLGSGTANSGTFLRGDGTWAAPTGTSAPDASTTSKGIVQLAGDLGGTAAAPTVPGLANKLDASQKGAASGVASLDASTKVPAAQIPDLSGSYVTKPATVTNGQTVQWSAGSGTWVAATPSAGVPGKAVAPSGDTTGATDKANINQALIDVSAAGGGSVYLLGQYYVNGPIKLTTGVKLDGSSPKSSVINLVAGSNTNVVELTSGCYHWAIQNLVIDGHSESNTAGAGLYLSAPAAANSDADGFRGGPWNLVDRVYTMYTKGHGFYISGGSGGMNETRVRNCYAIRAGGSGFMLDGWTDGWIDSCSTGESYSDGFDFTLSSDVRVSNCKSWWSGYCPPRGSNPNLNSPTNSSASGYTLRGNGMMISNCVAEDSANHGIVVNGINNLVDIGCDGSRGLAHVFIGGDGNNIRITSKSGANHSPTGAMLRLQGGKGNVVTSNWPENRSGNNVQSGIYNDGGYAETSINQIQIGTPRSLRAVAYAATVTPNVLSGGMKTTLTGNITINNPLAGSDIFGTETEFMLTQDATGGRTVAWGTSYKNATAADTAANKVNRWRFRCDGVGSWRQISYESY